MNTATTSIAIKEDASGPLADVVFDQVLDAIYQGRLAPGSVINEVALAQEFGVSRGPVREAVRRLQGIQLITREPYIKARVVTLSAESALELFQMRMALEGVACNLATRRMSDEEIAQLLAELEQDRQRRLAAANGGAPAPRVFDFHERIVRASGNNRIINALCGDLYHLLRVYRRHSGTVLERKDDAYAEHWQILRAIRARDAELAESLMRSHIERAAQHLFEHLAEGASGIAGHPVSAA
ncbi:GntR family transcriptional regulator [Achromobacter anxifer]|jgi:DNA-binding GntR family transcriptional regulator|uniref:Putative D-xylose utilization operon transcriptional repressor n=1 Tax=Achromobacter anxifer TaxID=1287737 RepID=A0A6S7CRA6_9BURK|nr:GntR family transcriptional regulator [Achromobacter anxifer]MDF8365899.1 GntR family transcriptional regulator [Achromobacter anxifer]CAB3859776.1 putative D-xylose utilization operon transcriptional repressor [Achromobacter anxifer]CAB5510930.1 putative D-xylose utilization operon transcriptional repressor [Achromobacter anxifer]